MFLRIFSTAIVLLLAGCADDAGTSKASEMLAGERIECAIGAGASFAETCTLERAENNVLIVRHEDGGFRKLTVNAAGTIDTADGADGIQLMLLPDGRSDIVIGTDRYRLPAAL